MEFDFSSVRVIESQLYFLKNIKSLKFSSRNAIWQKQELALITLAAGFSLKNKCGILN